MYRTAARPRNGLGLNELLGGGSKTVTANRRGLDELVKRCNQRFPARNSVPDRWKRQRRFVTFLAVPDLCNPDCIWITWVVGNDIAEAPRHFRNAFEEDRGKGVTLPRDGFNLALFALIVDMEVMSSPT